MEGRLYRSRNDKKIAGVCGGIAEFFGVDSSVIRLLWLISIFIYGTGLFVYFIAAIIIPEREDFNTTINLHKDSDKVDKQRGGTSNRRFNSEKDKRLLGYIFIIVGVVLLGKKFLSLWWLSFKFVFPIALIVFGLFILGSSLRK